MKVKSSMPLKKWLWMLGAYIACCVIGLVICTSLVNGGNITLDGAKLSVALVVFLSGMLIGILSKGLPILGIAVPVGIIILLNTAASILVFHGIGDGFLLQNGAVVLGGLLGFWVANKSGRMPKGKRRRKRSG